MMFGMNSLLEEILEIRPKIIWTEYTNWSAPERICEIMENYETLPEFSTVEVDNTAVKTFITTYNKKTVCN